MTWLRRLFHRHRWATLAVTLDRVTIIKHACWCGATKQTDQGD